MQNNQSQSAHELECYASHWKHCISLVLTTLITLATAVTAIPASYPFLTCLIVNLLTAQILVEVSKYLCKKNLGLRNLLYTSGGVLASLFPLTYCYLQLLEENQNLFSIVVFLIGIGTFSAVNGFVIENLRTRDLTPASNLHRLTYSQRPLALFWSKLDTKKAGFLWSRLFIFAVLIQVTLLVRKSIHQNTGEILTNQLYHLSLIGFVTISAIKSNLSQKQFFQSRFWSCLALCVILIVITNTGVTNLLTGKQYLSALVSEAGFITICLFVLTFAVSQIVKAESAQDLISFHRRKLKRSFKTLSKSA